MSILVTGGAGFIGSNFILDWAVRSDELVINLDRLTYAGNPANLATLTDPARYLLIQGDIGDGELVADLLARYRPRAIFNFAAESHVDRSIHAPGTFIQTNVVGTFTLLEIARIFYVSLRGDEERDFRFIHISTDEVYGSLNPADPPFTETSLYAPNSPYSASKAAANHLVRAYFHTYGLPTVTTNCSNNYGPFQFPEKFIPLMILNAINDLPLPIYGDGLQVRDWLHVADHCAALRLVLEKGRPGETYNIGGDQEKTNWEVVTTICDILDRLKPRLDGHSYREMIRRVQDRPGHDRRYAICADKLKNAMGWQPTRNFTEGLVTTIDWYLRESAWLKSVNSGAYRDWVDKQYGLTAGVGAL